MSTSSNFDQDYGVFQYFVKQCNLEELEKCKSFVEEIMATTISEQQINDYVVGLQKFSPEQRQKIRDRLASSEESKEDKPKREAKPKRSEDSKPSGYIEITRNGKQYWVPQLINPDNDQFFSAGSPRNKPWVGDFKTEDDKRERRTQYGADIVLQQYPEKLKTLAKKEAVYRKEGEIFVKVSAEEV